MKKKRSAGRRSKAGVGRRQNRSAMFCITFVVCILLAALLCEGHSLRQKVSKNEAKAAKLEAEITDEDQRTADIDALEEYMQSDAYLEKAAKEKLGLVKDNEIIFKEKQ